MKLKKQYRVVSLDLDFKTTIVAPPGASIKTLKAVAKECIIGRFKIEKL